jgi:hypothetical protein
MNRFALLFSTALAASVLTIGAADARGPWITLYSSNHFQGPSVTIHDGVPNLDAYGFTDRARSVQVEGVWLMCSARRFEGDCITIDHDIADLKHVGMSRRANSVRPRHHHDRDHEDD